MTTEHQKIVYGIDALKEALNGSKKVLLVHGSSFGSFSVKEAVERINVPYVVFDQFTSNPLYEDVCKGVEKFCREECDTILAVGGGSTIDVAKCIKLFCRMTVDRLYLEQEYKDTGIRLIAIPTTAGSGSESTRYAVIYYDGKKQSVTHDSIIPNVAILEPTVLKSLPLYQKKCTMLDALCQGIESWWSVNSNDDSKSYSRIAVETIIQWWRPYIFDNTEEAARHIMTAANIAGRAICITQTTAAHAFSYKITSRYGFPHGHAVAVGLPEIWQFMIEHMDQCIDTRGKAYLSGVFHDIATAMGQKTPADAIRFFRSMLDSLDIVSPQTTTFNSDIDLLSHSVNPIRLRNNPIELDLDSIVKIYKDIIQEKTS